MLAKGNRSLVALANGARLLAVLAKGARRLALVPVFTARPIQLVPLPYVIVAILDLAPTSICVRRPVVMWDRLASLPRARDQRSGGRVNATHGERTFNCTPKLSATLWHVATTAHLPTHLKSAYARAECPLWRCLMTRYDIPRPMLACGDMLRRTMPH